jgi:hypothetical protein
LEVVSSTPTNVLLQLPTDPGIIAAEDRRKRGTAVVGMQILGFVHEQTDKFRVRPNAIEFLFALSRKYNLAIMSNTFGLIMKCGLFGVHELLFAAEDADVDPYLSRHDLDSSTAFILDVETLTNTPNIETIRVNPYVKTNNKDIDLDIKSDLCQFVLSIHDKTNIGIHVAEFNN